VTGLAWRETASDAKIEVAGTRSHDLHNPILSRESEPPMPLLGADFASMSIELSRE
jgi:hypothetical protein